MIFWQAAVVLLSLSSILIPWICSSFPFLIFKGVPILFSPSNPRILKSRIQNPLKREETDGFLAFLKRSSRALLTIHRLSWDWIINTGKWRFSSINLQHERTSFVWKYFIWSSITCGLHFNNKKKEALKLKKLNTKVKRIQDRKWEVKDGTDN